MAYACPICKEPADQPLQIHYGGPACFSCRAFFRRAHQKTKMPNFKCKKNNQCEVTVKTRRKCQKCRYDICIGVGMNPEAVLTDDQKKARFRNSIKKKATKRPRDHPFDLSGDEEYFDEGFGDHAEAEENIPIEAAEGLKEPKTEAKYHEEPEHPEHPDIAEHSDETDHPDEVIQESVEIRTYHENSEEPSCSKILRFDHTNPMGPFSFLMEEAGSPGSNLGERRVLKKIECFMLTNDQINMDSSFVSELVSYHHGESILTHASFCGHLKALGSQFRHLALMNLEFLQLSKNDQMKLLSRNTPLFIQYILARYLTSETGYEQLTWLLGNHVPPMTHEEKTLLKKVSLKRLNQHLNLFHFGAYLDTYREFAQRLNIRTLQFKCTAIWCHIILFQTDASMTLENADLVQRFCNDSLKICEHTVSLFKCKESPDISGMLFTAEAMARFFAQNVIWVPTAANDSGHDSSSPEPSSPPKHESSSPESFVPALKYSAEEESWLQKQLDTFDEAWKAIPIGEDMIKEFVMYAYDVPLSKWFMPRTIKVFNHRYLRIMQMHPEFRALTDSQQELLWKNNSHFGTAMSIAKLESTVSGLDQHMFACGEGDHLTWLGKQAFERKLKKLTVATINKSAGVLSKTMMESFDRIIGRIGGLLQKPDNFKLFALVLLFSEVDHIPSMRDLRNSYLNVIRRRHMKMYNETANLPEGNELAAQDEFAFGTMVYSRFNSCVCDIKELTMILRKFM